MRKPKRTWLTRRERINQLLLSKPASPQSALDIEVKKMEIILEGNTSSEDPDLVNHAHVRVEKERMIEWSQRTFGEEDDDEP